MLRSRYKANHGFGSRRSCVSESKVAVNTTTFCANPNPDPNTSAGKACQTAINNFGKAKGRASYLTPRNFQFTALVRF